MLVLSRRVGEMVCIGPHITVTVIDVQGNQVKLGFSAPKDIRVDRPEIRAKVEAGITHKRDAVRQIP
jgi:carbon storage regulator